MSTTFIVLVTLHVAAALSWIGGMVFLSIVLAPLIRSGTFPGSTALLRAAALRFRPVVWTAIAVLLTTGPLLILQRGFGSPGEWPAVLLIKLALVALLLCTTVLHDVFIGPRVSRISALPLQERSAADHQWLRVSRWLPRLSLLIATAVVVAAVYLARS